MANWLNTINISRAWYEPNVLEISKDIVDGLHNIKMPEEEFEIDYERLELINKFESFMMDVQNINDPESIEEFNYLMEDLYNFADTTIGLNKKLAWIEK